MNDKVTEQQCLVLAGQKAGGGSVYSPSLLTLQKCSPDEFLLEEMTRESPCSEDSLQGAKEAKLSTGELRPRSDVFKFLILSSRQC